MTKQSRSYFQNIPEDILDRILYYLKTVDRWTVAGVCRSWREGAKNLNYCKEFIGRHMTPQRINKLLPHLPNSVTHFYLQYQNHSCLDPSTKQTAPLFLDLMRNLQCKCPLLKSLTIVFLCYKMFLQCRACICGSIEDVPVNKLNNHDIEKCCELNACLRYNSILPNIEDLSLRYIDVKCHNNNDNKINISLFELKRNIFPNLKVLDISGSPDYPFIRFPKEFIDKICLSSNIQELYLSSAYFDTFSFENIFKTMKILRAFSYSGSMFRRQYTDELFRAARKYARNLEQLCVAKSYVVHASSDEELCLPKLRSLCLKHCYVDVDTLKEILTSYPSLNSIDVLWSSVDPIRMRKNVVKDLSEKIIYESRRKNSFFCAHFEDNGHYRPPFFNR